MKNPLPTADQLKLDWTNNARWAGVTRPYSAEDVVRLRGTVPIEHSLARLGAEKLWRSLQSENFVNALGALTGNQAMQQVKAGLKAIYLSGWQVAADANLAGEMYPDQSLYPANSGPQWSSGSTTLRAPIAASRRGDTASIPAPIVADAEAGFGRAQCLRIDEGDDRSRGRRCAFRGPARQRQEVRPHGWQGVGADARSHRQAGRRAPGRRRHGRADPDRGAHRCRGGGPADLGCRSQRPAVRHRRAHRRGFKD